MMDLSFRERGRTEGLVLVPVPIRNSAVLSLRLPRTRRHTHPVNTSNLPLKDGNLILMARLA